MINLRTQGVADKTARFFESTQLADEKLWAKFADVFRLHPDGPKNGWKGEFWGKMMRGACLVYEYTRSDALYNRLTQSVEDILTTADGDGRVSSYPRESEFVAWDIWCRKYVILAMEYYLDICRDEQLKARIISFIKGCADYVLLYVGEGKQPITHTSDFWYGLNSSSILEPMVKLFNLTGDKKYLNFATQIVNEGGAKGINIFKMAYENKLYPYQYGVSKAYEMMSCFEGLLEYYYATDIAWCKEAVVNFTKSVIDTELSIIGCSGITHELFDFTAARQTVRQEEVLQETCVTVTWMKLCSRVLELTGDPRYADCMEQSFYNAYLGAINTQGKLCPYARTEDKNAQDTFLPVDSYSPLLSSRRGLVIGGFQLLPDRSYYGCCACISSAGVGVFLKNMITADDNGITINFFEEGCARLTCKGADVTVTQTTNYPVEGKVTVTVKTDRSVDFVLKIRTPEWAGGKGYAEYKKTWSEDEITLDFDTSLRVQTPIKWNETVVYTDLSNPPEGTYVAAPVKVCHQPENDNYVALMKGPLTLAADSRCGRAASGVFDFEPVGVVCTDNEIAPQEPCLLKMKFTDNNGDEFYLVDYASAGKDWQSEIAAWLKTKA